MILNREVWRNRQRAEISKKLRKLEGIAYGRGLERLLNKVNKLFNDIMEYRIWENR